MPKIEEAEFISNSDYYLRLVDVFKLSFHIVSEDHNDVVCIPYEEYKTIMEG